ncbi:MAG TPA: M48 family metalloprotease [Stellaceae bacterium]|nr:M48 family metalloprotease [Stellaceae bacterium]
MRLRVVITALFLMLATSLGMVRSAAADDTPGFIRDAEIEDIIRTWWTPIILAAGLDPKAVHIYLVNDPTLNSFVAGGQNLFLNTGTLLRSVSPNQIVGIMAHETGHIAGGHLSRSEQAMKNATIAGIIAMAAGAAVAVVGHSSDAGAAAVLGGAGVSERSFLSFSVTQEASADHAAMTFLDRAHLSARGLLEFFGILEKEEMLAGQREDPYLRTHPLTRDRINYVRDHVEHSQWSNVPDPPDWIAMHKLMKAKLAAFLDAPSQTLAAYKEDDNSVPARYARAIAYYRIPQLKNALELIDGLIKDAPNDPYFQELKGQMLFENGRVKDAIAPYERAVALKPDSALLRIELAQVELESDDASQVPKALAFLNGATPFEGDNADLWRLLAIAYGRSGNMGMAALSLAEQGMADGDFNAARQEAARAIKLLPPGAQRQRAQDIADDARRSRDRGG